MASYWRSQPPGSRLRAICPTLVGYVNIFLFIYTGLFSTSSSNTAPASVKASLLSDTLCDSIITRQEHLYDTTTTERFPVVSDHSQYRSTHEQETMTSDSEIILVRPPTFSRIPKKGELEPVGSHGDCLDFTTLTDLQSLMISEQDKVNEGTYTAEERAPSPFNHQGQK